MIQKVYLISYDLKSPDGDYSGLYEALQSHGRWWHFLESTWLVSTRSTAEELREQLLPHIDEKDFLLFIDVGNKYQGWLPKEAWDWMRDNVTATPAAVGAGSPS